MVSEGERERERGQASVTGKSETESILLLKFHVKKEKG